MKTIGIFCGLMFCCLFCFAQTGEKNFIDQNYVEVTGTAEMEIVPDEIYVKIIISEKDKGKRSVESLEGDLVSVLKGLGIDVRQDLFIRNIGSDLRVYFLKGAVPQTTKEYVLLLHGAEKMGELVVRLEEKGISNLSIEKLSHSALEKFRKEVKVNAVKAAKDKAEAFAGAVGQQIGKALYINENPNAYRTLNRSSNIVVRGVASPAKYEVPALEFEKIRLEYSVVVRFELK